MRRANYNYVNLTQAEYIAIVSLICFCCASNPNFPDLPVAVADILAKLAAYEKALDKGKMGDSVQVATAKALRKDLDVMLRKNGIYINDVANGDLIILESCGYQLSKESSRNKKDAIKITQSSQSGTGKVVIRAVEGAVTYLAETCPDPIPVPDNPAAWTRHPMCTRSYFWISGLTPLKKYWIRFYVATVDGESDASIPFAFSVK